MKKKANEVPINHNKHIDSHTQIEDMYYAVIFGDATARLSITYGILFFALQIYYIRIFKEMIKRYEVVMFDFLTTIIFGVLFVFAGIGLGFVQSHIRFSDVTKRTKKVAAIQKAMVTFNIFKLISYGISYTRLYMIVIVIALALMWFFLLVTKVSINYFPLTGFSLALTDFLLWKLYYRKIITESSEYKTFLF